MAGKTFKFEISVPTATIASKEINLSFKGYNRRGQKHNAYRVKAIKCQIDDLDAEAAADLFLKLQLAYDDRNGETTYLTIDNKDEILTLAQMEGTMTAVNAIRGNLTPDEIREQGILFLDGRDFAEVYIVKETVWMNAGNSGQDATEVFHMNLVGNYVHLEKDEIDAMKSGVTLT